jgi:hypothetical protein
VHVQTGSLDQKILGPFRDKWEGRRPRISVLGPIPCGATSRPIEIKVRSSTGVTDPLWDHHVLLKLSGRESMGGKGAGWNRDRGLKQYRSYRSFLGSLHALEAFGSRERGWQRS